MLWVPSLTCPSCLCSFHFAPCRWSWWNTSVNSCSASRKCQRRRGPSPWTATHTYETGYAPSTCGRSSSRYVVLPSFPLFSRAAAVSDPLLYSCDHVIVTTVSWLQQLAASPQLIKMNQIHHLLVLWDWFITFLCNFLSFSQSSWLL